MVELNQALSEIDDAVEQKFADMVAAQTRLGHVLTRFETTYGGSITDGQTFSSHNVAATTDHPETEVPDWVDSDPGTDTGSLILRWADPTAGASTYVSHTVAPDPPVDATAVVETGHLSVAVPTLIQIATPGIYDIEVTVWLFNGTNQNAVGAIRLDSRPNSSSSWTIQGVYSDRQQVGPSFAAAERETLFIERELGAGAQLRASVYGQYVNDGALSIARARFDLRRMVIRTV